VQLLTATGGILGALAALTAESAQIAGKSTVVKYFGYGGCCMVGDDKPLTDLNVCYIHKYAQKF
jgi:hypothetical protein